MRWLRRFLGRNGWEVAATLFPVFADAVHWFTFDPLQASFRGLLGAPSSLALGVLFGLYAAWLVTLVLVKWLEPEVLLRPAEARSVTARGQWLPVLFFYPSALFGLAWLMNLFDASGFGKPAAPMSEGLQQAVLLGGLGLFVAHLVIMAVDLSPRFTAGTAGHFFAFAAAVVVGEVVLNLSLAQWLHVFSADPTKPDQVLAAAARSPTELVFTTLLVLVFFAGPRFTFLARHFTVPSLLSGLAFLLWDVWVNLGAV